MWNTVGNYWEETLWNLQETDKKCIQNYLEVSCPQAPTCIEVNSFLIILTLTAGSANMRCLWSERRYKGWEKDGNSDGSRRVVWHKPRPIWDIPLSLRTGFSVEWNLGLPSSASRVTDWDPSSGYGSSQQHPAKSREMELAPREACNTEDWPTHKIKMSAEYTSTLK